MALVMGEKKRVTEMGKIQHVRLGRADEDRL